MMVTSLLWVATMGVLLEAATGLGSMSSIAVSYGDKGSVFCGLTTDGTHFAACYGANSAITLSTPRRLRFLSLTAGDGFVCGLLRRPTALPFCWGASAYVPMGVLSSTNQYLEITAGDYHLCALRQPSTGRRRFLSVVDCWGYNMTRTFSFDSPIHSLSAGSDFTCALFSGNRTAFCWGDDSSSRVAALAPRSLSFQTISAGGYHVCGILDSPDSRAVCWGRSLDSDADFVSSSVDAPPPDPMLYLAGGKFHACGIRISDRGVICWGLVVKPASPVPVGLRAYEIAAGNYFTCGIIAGGSLLPVCWGSGFPASLPIAAAGELCRRTPCAPGYYEQRRSSSSECRVCVPCTAADCPEDTFLKSECSARSDRVCSYNCSACGSAVCSAACSAASAQRFWSVQVAVIAAEIAFAALLVAAVVLYIRHRLRGCRCDKNLPCSGAAGPGISPAPPQPEHVRSSSNNTRRARLFAYGELERATSRFSDESLVGKGSFSDVFRGVLDDGTVVAVKRAVKRWKEFQTELDLLSRLNHAHLLNLLGFCEQGDERLLVYEYMANGSLHQHLHGTTQLHLDWVRRATIAVQAARGIEYLHGYACPPVIHRDIKSSNILIDEDHNARVADFGLSLLGPADSCSPLPELPAGTLGYLDPEYYRLHYLTTKSDVYSFGVLLLEILSGRKAIHMDGERAVNIVEWAVPLLKSGDAVSVLDPGPPPAAPAAEEALRRMANVACKCVRMRGKERPSMDKVTTALERALALLIEQPILPTEIVLGSTRLHNNKQSSDRITYPSLPSSHRRKSSSVDHDHDHDHDVVSKEEEEEICPAGSPNHDMFLHHNF